MNLKLRARLRLRKTDDGGREMPISSGYRPDVTFDTDIEHLYGVTVTFACPEYVAPGEEAEVVVEPRCPDQWDQHWFNAGTNFALCEGTRIVGTGSVLGYVPELSANFLNRSGA